MELGRYDYGWRKNKTLTFPGTVNSEVKPLCPSTLITVSDINTAIISFRYCYCNISKCIPLGRENN